MSDNVPRRSVAVMCCGCFRFLSKDNQVLDGEIQKPADGLLDWAMFEQIKSEILGQIACFENAKAADIAAKSAGWAVRDASGPNHRCPDCEIKRRQAEPTPETVINRGAYVMFENGKPKKLGAI
jgi:hypothetical protein